MLNNLSYRYKIPLGIALIILVTGISVSSLFLISATKDARNDLIAFSQILGSALAQTLGEMIRNDATWDAYLLIRSPHQKNLSKEMRPQDIIVLDNKGRIFASTNPKQYPLQRHLKQIKNDFFDGNAIFKDHQQKTLSQGDRFIISLPILLDDSPIGSIFLLYDMAVLQPRLWQKLQDLSATTTVLILLLLPLGLLLGKRFAQPLVQLADCMSDINKAPKRTENCELYSGKDEVGLLSQRFKEMLFGLKEKQILEKTIVSSNRLAAIGQLVAGIAHEINNPLGGMLNSLDTLKTHGKKDDLTIKTTELLERGLQQIRSTVSALLIESRVQHQLFSREDMDDILTLVNAEKSYKQIVLQAHCQIEQEFAIPSTLLRQLLLNLLFNAIHAAPSHGSVSLSLTENEKNELELKVSNNCKHLPDQQFIERIFEPFFSGEDSQGTGLGLWVSYQIVKQLNGSIQANVEQFQVVVHAVLPLQIKKSS